MDNKKRACVFCGSSKGNNPAFTAEAKQLGIQLAQKDIGLVYGGGSVGIMNAVANGVLSKDGEVRGLIPEHLNNSEHAHKGITELYITQTMHQRKAKMAELANAFITLPGGFGTFEELMEVITWSQLELHQKPVIIYNIDGYYDKLIEFISYATQSGFISPQNRQQLKVADTVEACLQHLPFAV